MLLTLILIIMLALIGSLLWCLENYHPFLALILYFVYLILAIKVGFMIC